MNYSGIKKCDIANGIGVRTSLFVSGCRHHCQGCFNPETWDFATGEPFGPAAEEEILSSLQAVYVDGLSILGGEPLEPENQEVLTPFLELVKQRFPNKGIWLWSGFTWESLGQKGCRAHTPYVQRILACLDVLVDGPFVLAQKDLTLRFRGSANQRLINVPASLKAGEVVIWSDEPIFSTHTW